MSGNATNTDKEVSWLSLVAKARTKNNHQWSGLLVAERGGGGRGGGGRHTVWMNRSFNSTVSLSH